MGEAISGVGAVLVVCLAIWWVAEKALDKQKIGRVEGNWPKRENSRGPKAGTKHPLR
jgi:hypothetical protein